MAKLIKKVDRTVTQDEKEIKIYVERPNNHLVKLADRHKSKAWNQAIQDDVLTKKELAVLYWIGYVSILVGGRGAYSLSFDHLLPNKKWVNWAFDRNKTTN